ncbi:ABC transporter ATP-binding protein [Paenibacillus rhizovicinus]|uniref:ABC transporter ATP-binding protein n=1 Tax=Paenibacillus rhizovicinus TaxID=2704463 RepID=A0A6C0P7F8_9BACL|nr:ABC transporter ATP-binding protein [Paenibacillus rhizovicinus]QHW34326.1 ABC transporter ATP-binding protein [Paenibacillus rhizovicinus]
MERVERSKARNLNYEHTFQQVATQEEQSTFKFLISLYRGNFLNLTLSVLFYMVKSLPIFVLPVVTANIINIVSHPGANPMRSLWINFAVIGVIILQNIPTHTWYVSFMSRAIRHVEAGIRSALVRKLQQLSITYHRDLQAGKLQSKVLRDVEAVEQLSKQIMLALLPAVFNIIIAVIMTAYNSWSVSMFFVLTIPAAVLLVRLFKGKISSTNKEFRREIEKMSSKMSEMVEMIPVTRAHGLEEVEIERIDKSLYKLQGKGQRLDIIEAYFGASNWVTFQLFQVLCLMFTAYLAYKGTIPVGNIVMYQGFFSMILGSVTALITTYPNMAKGFESIHSITEILRSQEIEHNQGKLRLTDISGEIEFENVQLIYPGSEHHVLEEVTLSVRAGECVAFVGESGAGKSTILNLVTGFLQPTGGKMTVDGVDYNAIDLREYRKFLSVVPQTNILFSGTIRDNITYGLPDITDDQIRKAIEMANLAEFVDRQPLGIHTKVGEHGGKLSGGQRQRIAIARALIRNPKVIILDEATSALDNASEYHVQKAMQELIKGRTTFIVAHRLSTIRDADRIVVMKQGRIAEVGTFDELIARKGEFYHLKQLQL